MVSLGAAPSPPRLLALLNLAAACTSPGSGTITYVYGPDIQDVEDLTFERPSFDSCPDCDWYAASIAADGGSYFDGVGWDDASQTLYRYTEPGATLDGTNEGWLAYHSEAELAQYGYTWTSSFEDDTLEVYAARPSYWNNRCEDGRDLFAVAARDIDVPETGAITVTMDCAAWAQHQVALEAGQRALFWVTTDQALTSPALYVGYDGCNSGYGDRTVPCNADDGDDVCPAVEWEVDTAHTAVLSVTGFRRACPDGTLTYTLHWAAEGAIVGEATTTSDPSPYLLPFTESHTVSFSFSLTEPGPF